MKLRYENVFSLWGGGKKKNLIYFERKIIPRVVHIHGGLFISSRWRTGLISRHLYLIRYLMLPMEMYDTCFLTLFQKNLQIFFERDRKPVNLTSSNGVHCEVYVPGFGGGRTKLSQLSSEMHRHHHHNHHHHRGGRPIVVVEERRGPGWGRRGFGPRYPRFVEPGTF